MMVLVVVASYYIIRWEYEVSFWGFFLAPYENAAAVGSAIAAPVAIEVVSIRPVLPIDRVEWANTNKYLVHSSSTNKNTTYTAAVGTAVAAYLFDIPKTMTAVTVWVSTIMRWGRRACAEERVRQYDTIDSINSRIIWSSIQHRMLGMTLLLIDMID